MSAEKDMQKRLQSIEEKTLFERLKKLLLEDNLKACRNYFVAVKARQMLELQKTGILPQDSAKLALPQWMREVLEKVKFSGEAGASTEFTQEERQKAQEEIEKFFGDNNREALSLLGDGVANDTLLNGFNGINLEALMNLGLLFFSGSKDCAPFNEESICGKSDILESN